MSNVNSNQQVDNRQTEKWKHSSAINIVGLHVIRTARVVHSTVGQGNVWFVYQLSLWANVAWSPRTSTRQHASRVIDV